jgi:hypothetical protein
LSFLSGAVVSLLMRERSNTSITLVQQGAKNEPLLGFFEARFSKRPPGGLVDQEAHFRREHPGHAGRA